jgi:hypothetical protein
MMGGVNKQRNMHKDGGEVAVLGQECSNVVIKLVLVGNECLDCDDLSHGTFSLDFLNFCTICTLTFVFLSPKVR